MRSLLVPVLFALLGADVYAITQSREKYLVERLHRVYENSAGSVIHSTPWINLTVPQPKQQLRSFLQMAAELTAEEKKFLLDTAVSDLKNMNQVPLAIRLALGNESAWIRLLKLSLNHDGIPVIPFFREYRPHLESLSPQSKRVILRKLAPLYLSLEKSGLGKPEVVRYMPKRVADAWLRILIGGSAIIERNIKNKKSPLRAYQDYLDQVERFTRLVDRSEFINLSAKQILMIAREVQNTMRRFNEPRRSKVLMHGSLLKGLARKGSDLDLVTNVQSSKHLLFGNSREKLGLTQSLPILLKSFGVRSTLRIQIAGELQNMLEFGGMLEPVMVEVTTEKINLLIFPAPFKTSLQESDYKQEAYPIEDRFQVAFSNTCSQKLLRIRNAR